MNKDFKNNLINKIKKEEIKPISKNFFILKKFFINLFLFFSILVWALSIAIVFWYLLEADWYLSHKIWLIKITITFLPIFWLIFLFFSSILSYYNFKQTEKWYKFYLWQIVVVNIIISFLLWMAFYFSWFSQKVEEKIQNNISNYREIFVWDKISRMKQIWQNENSGLLLGIILEKNNNLIKLKDTNGKIWNLLLSNETIIRHKLKLKTWLKIKLIWEKIEKNTFKITEIRPFIWNWFEKNHKKQD